MHVPDQERSKLDNYSEKYVFIGMIQALRVISCEIQAPKISWDVNLMKNAYRIRALKKKKNIICFPPFNEDEQMNEVLDELPLQLHH